MSRPRQLRREQHRCTRLLAALACASLAGCATASGPAPRSNPYEGRCVLLDLEQRDAPGPADADAVTLVVRYRWEPAGGAKTAVEPLEMAVQVSRTRAAELDASLRSQPDVLCRGDRDALGGKDPS